MKKTISCMFIIISQFLFSQQQKTQEMKATFKGSVVDNDTNRPVSFASIFIKELGVYRFCEENGTFNIALELDYDSQVVISAIGYQKLGLLLSELKGKIKLKPQIEQLNEVIVTAEKRIAPIEVIKNAIKQKKNNYATKPFNQKRYTKLTVAEQDGIILDFEVINDEFHPGYHKDYLASQSVEQIKWNIGNYGNSIYKSAWNIAGEGRTDQVQYASFLRLNRYKNFDYKFVTSEELSDNTNYVIDYRPKDFSWKSTQFDHSVYHSNAQIQAFKGKVFIRKKDFAVLKVEEEWLANQKVSFYNNIGMSLKEPTMSDSLWVISKQQKVYNVSDYKLSNREIFEYQIEKDGLNYPSKYLKIQKVEYIDSNGEHYYGSVSQNSKYLDVRTNQVIKYPWEGWSNPKKYSSLDRVNYNPVFWSEFYSHGASN